MATAQLSKKNNGVYPGSPEMIGAGQTGKSKSITFPAFWPQMLHDDCLVRLEKPERMTATKLLWIPDSAQRDDYELYQGLVLAVGPGRRRPSRKRPELEKLMGSPPSVFASEIVPNEIHPGDRVLFTWAAMKADKANCQWSKDGEEFRIVSEWQIQMAWPGNLKLEEAFR